MSDPIDTCALHRIPGLYRRWELAQLLALGEDYHIEDAGRTSDGGALLAVYRSRRDASSEPEDAA